MNPGPDDGSADSDRPLERPGEGTNGWRPTMRLLHRRPQVGFEKEHRDVDGDGDDQRDHDWFVRHVDEQQRAEHGADDTTDGERAQIASVGQMGPFPNGEHAVRQQVGERDDHDGVFDVDEQRCDGNDDDRKSHARHRLRHGADHHCNEHDRQLVAVHGGSVSARPDNS